MPLLKIASIFACIKPWFYKRSQRYARNDDKSTVIARSRTTKQSSVDKIIKITEPRFLTP
jgi:hypothetical protein